MRRSIAVFVAAFAMLSATSLAGRAQHITVIPAIGMSKDMRSKTSNRWNSGPNAAAAVFFKQSDAASFGVRLAYHKWGIDGDGWAKDEAKKYGDAYTYQVESASGSQSVIEIFPAARFALTRGPGPVDVAAHIGVGYVIVNQSAVSGSAQYQGGVVSQGHITIAYPSESLNGPGIQAGLPVTLGGIVEVMPVYNLYRHNGDLYHHIGVSVGAVIRM